MVTHSHANGMLEILMKLPQFLYENMSTRLVQTVMRFACIQEILSTNLIWDASHNTEIYYGYCYFVQANAEVVCTLN
jgi:hypothetical protein